MSLLEDLFAELDKAPGLDPLLAALKESLRNHLPPQSDAGAPEPPSEDQTAAATAPAPAEATPETPVDPTAAEQAPQETQA